MDKGIQESLILALDRNSTVKNLRTWSESTKITILFAKYESRTQPHVGLPQDWRKNVFETNLFLRWLLAKKFPTDIVQLVVSSRKQWGLIGEQCQRLDYNVFSSLKKLQTQNE